MPENVSGTVRDILTKDITRTADDVIRLAKARGLAASAETIRATVHNVRSDLKKQGVKPPAAKTTASPASVPTPVAPPAVGLADVLANVARVDAVVRACGGVQQAREAAEAVRACGSVEAFLQHLDTVAGIRTGG